MTRSADIRAEAKRIQSVFVAAGAAPLEAELLQPADTLLDLYGEDIRPCLCDPRSAARRAYATPRFYGSGRANAHGPWGRAGALYLFR